MLANILIFKSEVKQMQRHRNGPKTVDESKLQKGTRKCVCVCRGESLRTPESGAFSKLTSTKMSISYHKIYNSAARGMGQAVQQEKVVWPLSHFLLPWLKIQLFLSFYEKSGGAKTYPHTFQSGGIVYSCRSYTPEICKLKTSSPFPHHIYKNGWCYNMYHLNAHVVNYSQNYI